MLNINKSTQKELDRVQSIINKELITEQTIKEIYDYIFQSEGKKTRALISLLSSRSKNTTLSKRIQLASVIELLHTATLVHDDVVDESNLRRGSKSVNQVWTNSYSVLIGDFIYSKAFILMVKLNQAGILGELASATNDIARGEMIQLEMYEKKLSLTLADLLKVSYLKTGRLFEASAKTGAILAGAKNNEIKNFGLLGRSLGIAFQIQDDILDYKSFKLNTGKPVLKDFKEGKITFPLFYAIQNATLKDKKFLLDNLGKKNIALSKQKKIYDLVISKPSIKETQALLEQYLCETKKYLSKLNNHPSYDEMLNLINFSKKRRK